MDVSAMRTKFTVLTLCAIIWYALSGEHSALDLVAGIGGSLAVTALIYRLGFSLDIWKHYSWKEGLLYVGWLLKEIILSSFGVAKYIWQSQPEKGVFCDVQHPNGDPIGLSVHANSITLTPGTVTVNCNHGDTLLVHALTDAMRDEVIKPGLLTRIHQLQRQK